MIFLLLLLALAYLGRQWGNPLQRLIPGVICLALAYFWLIGAAIAGDIADPLVLVPIGALVLIGLAAVLWRRRRHQS